MVRPGDVIYVIMWFFILANIFYIGRFAIERVGTSLSTEGDTAETGSCKVDPDLAHILTTPGAVPHRSGMIYCNSSPPPPVPDGTSPEVPRPMCDSLIQFFLTTGLTDKYRSFPPTLTPSCSHILCKFTRLLNEGILRLPRPEADGNYAVEFVFGLRSNFSIVNGEKKFVLDYRDLYPGCEDEHCMGWYYSKINGLFGLLSQCSPFVPDPICYPKQREFVEKINSLIKESGLSYEMWYIASSNMDHAILSGGYCNVPPDSKKMYHPRLCRRVHRGDGRQLLLGCGYHYEF